MSDEFFSDGYLHDATRAEKEEFLIFSMFVAGKPADKTWEKVRQFFEAYNHEDERVTPFAQIASMITFGDLRPQLERVRVGKYDLYEKGLRSIIENDIDAENCTIEEFEQIPGIGRKTSRFYKLYTDPDFRGIPIDTHLLSFLQQLGFDAPDNTPSSGRQYHRWEQVLLMIYDALELSEDFTIQDFDYGIWSAYSNDEKQVLADNMLRHLPEERLYLIAEMDREGFFLDDQQQASKNILNAIGDVIRKC